MVSFLSAIFSGEVIDPIKHSSRVYSPIVFTNLPGRLRQSDYCVLLEYTGCFRIVESVMLRQATTLQPGFHPILILIRSLDSCRFLPTKGRPGDARGADSRDPATVSGAGEFRRECAVAYSFHVGGVGCYPQQQRPTRPRGGRGENRSSETIGCILRSTYVPVF